MEKVYPAIVAVIKRIFRSLHLTLSCLYASLLIVNGVAFALSVFVEDEQLISNVSAITAVVGKLLSVLVFVVCFSLYDEDSKHKYLVNIKNTNAERSFKYDLDFMLHFRFRYTDYVALFVLFLLTGFNVIATICVLVLYFASSLVATSLWINELHSHDYESYNESKLISFKGFITVLVYLLDITLIFYVVPLFLTYVITFAKLFKAYAYFFTVVIAALILVFLARGYNKRRKFLHDLKNVCKENNASIKIYPAARSLFFSGRRVLTLEKDDKRYDIYFIPSLIRSNVIRIYDGFKYNKVFRIAIRNRNKFTLTIPVTFKKRVHFKGENTEVIVFSPAPKTAQVKEKGIRTPGELHDADKIWGVSTFSGQGFRNAFDRVCRDKQTI